MPRLTWCGSLGAMSDGFDFLPSARVATPPERGVWLVFRHRALLVSQDFGLPHAITPSELGLVPVRTQYLGTLAGQPCFSAEVAADSAPPEGAQFLDLLQLYGRLSPA